MFLKASVPSEIAALPQASTDETTASSARDPFLYSLSKAKRHLDDADIEALGAFAYDVFAEANRSDPALYADGLEIVRFLIRKKKWEAARKAIKKALPFTVYPQGLPYREALLTEAFTVCSGSLREGSLHDARKASKIILRAHFVAPRLFQRTLALNEKIYRRGLKEGNVYEAFKACENDLLLQAGSTRSRFRAVFLNRVALLISRTLSTKGYFLAEKMAETLGAHSQESPLYADYSRDVLAFLSAKDQGAPPLLPVSAVERKNPFLLSSKERASLKGLHARLIAARKRHDWKTAARALASAEVEARSLRQYGFLDQNHGRALRTARMALKDGAYEASSQCLGVIFGAPQKSLSTYGAALPLDLEATRGMATTQEIMPAFWSCLNELVHQHLPETERQAPLARLMALVDRAVRQESFPREKVRDMAGTLAIHALADTLPYIYAKEVISFLNSPTADALPPRLPENHAARMAEAVRPLQNDFVTRLREVRRMQLGAWTERLKQT